MCLHLPLSMSPSEHAMMLISLPSLLAFDAGHGFCRPQRRIEGFKREQTCGKLNQVGCRYSHPLPRSGWGKNLPHPICSRPA